MMAIPFTILKIHWARCSSTAKLGVNAQLSGRNDLQVGERKISGNAQFTTKGRMFSHGTLMLNSEIENVVSALKVKDDKIKSKGIKSIRSRVANIAEFLSEPLTMEEFKTMLLRYIFNTESGAVPEHTLTETEWEQIHALSKSAIKTGIGIMANRLPLIFNAPSVFRSVRSICV